MAAKRWKRGTFLQGTLFGMALLLGLLFLLGVYLLRNGVQVYLDSQDVSHSVGAQVTWYAERDLPRMIDGAKAEIPEIVRREMQGQWGSTRMEIAGFVFNLPDELMEQLDGFMRENVENSVYQLLDGIDTGELAREIGETAALLVEEQMQEVLHGQTFYIKVLGPLDLPVTVFIQGAR